MKSYLKISTAAIVLAAGVGRCATAPARAAVRQVAHALGAQDVVEWPEPALARAAAFITTASEGGSLHLENLRRRPQDFEPLSVDRFIADLEAEAANGANA